MESRNVYDSIVIRSRTTILQMLEDRGFDTTPYAKLTGTNVSKMVPSKTTGDSEVGSQASLMMEVKHRVEPERRAIVLYSDVNLKTKLGSFISNLVENDENVKTTDYIIITTQKEEITEIFDQEALKAWKNHGMRITFFNMERIVNNPMHHVAQPKFEFVPPENHKELMKQWHVQSKTQFHHIVFHRDIVARYMGLVVGDIVKITRPSYSAGEYSLYRTCVP